MAEQYEPTDIHRQLLDLNQETFENGHYQSAYYCLVAALHHARDTGDLDSLRTIEVTARTQGKWLETHPGQKVNFSHFTFIRHGIHLYHALAHQAHVQAALVERWQNREKNRRPD